MSQPGTYTRKDFVSSQDVRWCPGCGDYAILGAIHNLLPTLGVPKENLVFVSGIGCSSRFPYYVDTYGFHTLHGRAPTIATGVRVANPDLDVWLVTGDGDGFSIGGNHLMHLLRRNVKMKVLLFNNRVYGLTKGQYSPTSPTGMKSKSSPTGSLDHPVNPCSVAIGAEASFVARTTDRNIKHLTETLARAHAHEGTAFIEILQNCVIFNDACWDDVYGKDHKEDGMVMLEQGKPLRFGAEGKKGIAAKGFSTEIVDADANADRLLIHDETLDDPTYAYQLTRLGIQQPGPMAMGVLRQVNRPVYEDELHGAITSAKTAKTATLADLYTGFGTAETWDVK
jgi:2-oxoglutarate/2-oxoacid ferredoxin oxidoreductase subunit beta